MASLIHAACLHLKFKALTLIYKKFDHLLDLDFHVLMYCICQASIADYKHYTKQSTF